MLIVKFNDGEILQGGGWDSLPNKPIQKIGLIINGKKAVLQGYEIYNHLVEHVFSIIDLEGNRTKDRDIFLMGMKDGKVTIIKFSNITGEMTKLESNLGEEYNGRPSTGWKQGLLDSIPDYKIF